MEDEIKRWTTKRKRVLVLDIIRSMENALRRAKPEDIREQYERQLKDLQEAYGEAMLERRTRKNCSPCWARTRNDRGVALI